METSTKLKSLIIPDFRFYITLFYSNSISHETIISKLKRNISDNETLIESQYEIRELEKFPYRHYDQLGVLEIKIGRVDTSEGKPVNVFQMSQDLKKALIETTDTVEEILFDTINLHPYALVIASELRGEKNQIWTTEEITKNKTLLGGWIEYYSGQWDDYSDELYNERIENNLSNRLTELHYIRSNSAFIYMERHDERWVGWMEYMEEIFINQVFLARSILYALILLNRELDELSERVRKMSKGSIKRLGEEIEFVEDLQLLVAEITSKLSSEKLMNRLHHSTKVITECFRVFSIDDAKKLVDEKIDKLHSVLQNEHETTQTKLQNQQKMWILILNGLIGYQVIFTIVDQVSEFFNINENGTPYKVFIGFIWSLLIGIITVSLSGFLRSYLKSKGKDKR
ncbi:MAG: hypothetical protein GPJ54_16405 [Candidatus Heimdallarchaeota archaeon]|nr:hypothetical protein [Candidatus Heimdallarchaeota archaeon]